MHTHLESPRVPALALLSALGLATPAWADRASAHATASGDVAFTDNVFSEQRGRQDGDLLFQVRPALILSYGIPRMIDDDPVTSKLSSSFGVARIDVGMQYLVRPGFSYTVRYELMVQTWRRSVPSR